MSDLFSASNITVPTTNNHHEEGGKKMKSALDAKRGNMFWIDPEAVIIVGLDPSNGQKDGPVSGKEHPLWDERINLPLDEGMLASIDKIGVRQNITVRKSGEHVELIDGRRRVLHAREINRRRVEAGRTDMVQVPCNTPFRGSDVEAMTLFVTLNNLRFDDAPIVRARKAQRMLDFGATEDEVANANGIKTATLGMLLRLLDADQAVQDAVEAGDLAPTAAVQLLSLSRPEQAEKVAALVGNANKKTDADGEPKKGKKRVTAKDVKKSMGKTVAPSSSLIKKLRKTKGWERLDESFLLGVAWMLGEVDHAKVKGLITIVREVGGEK